MSDAYEVTGLWRYPVKSMAGEAAAVQRIRHHLFDERGLSRSHAVVRGYWKHGRGSVSETN